MSQMKLLLVCLLFVFEEVISVVQDDNGTVLVKCQTVLVLEGTDAVIHWPLVDHTINHVTRVALYYSDLKGQVHNRHNRLMTYICKDGECTIHRSDPGKLRRFAMSHSARNILAMTIKGIKLTDEGIYKIKVLRDDDEKYEKETILEIVKDITYEVSIGSRTYNLSVGDNGTDVTLSGHGPVEIKFTSYRPSFFRLYPSEPEDEYGHKNIHGRSVTNMEREGAKIVDMSFSIENLPPIRIWRAPELDHEVIGDVMGNGSILNTHTFSVVMIISAIFCHLIVE